MQTRDIFEKLSYLKLVDFNFTPHKFYNFLADKPCTVWKARNQRWMNWITLLNELSREILVNEGENPFKETSFVSHAEQNVTRQNERQKKNSSANCIELVSWDGKAKLRKISIKQPFPIRNSLSYRRTFLISARLCRAVMTGNFRMY